jgi:hypothetical protein
MLRASFIFYQDLILTQIKELFYYQNRLTEKQWKEFMIDLQDLMYDIGFVYQAPKQLYSDSHRELNPDIKEFVEQTNRRLKDAR